MATNPMHQFHVYRIGPEIKFGDYDLSFTNASLFMLISAAVILIFLFLSSKKKSIIPNKIQLISELTYQFVSKMKSQPGGKRTTDLQCLVFAKSLPYDDQYHPGEKQVTVSTICPKLRTTMSVRISESEANKIDYKVYKFPNVQPIPLANRMRSWADRDKKVEDTSLVADLSA